MFAVIKTGGKQYVVKPGDKLEVEKLETEAGKELSFSEVLLIENDGKVEIGNPMLKGAKVSAKVLDHGKEEKVIVFKYKAKKRYARKIGHRQPFTTVEILEIKS
jgi:large subunit ribosomal protein L21